MNTVFVVFLLSDVSESSLGPKKLKFRLFVVSFPPRLPSQGLSGPDSGLPGLHAARIHQQPAGQSQSRAARIAGKL